MLSRISNYLPYLENIWPLKVRSNEKRSPTTEKRQGRKLYFSFHQSGFSVIRQWNDSWIIVDAWSITVPPLLLRIYPIMSSPRYYFSTYKDKVTTLKMILRSRYLVVAFPYYLFSQRIFLPSFKRSWSGEASQVKIPKTRPFWLPNTIRLFFSNLRNVFPTHGIIPIESKYVIVEMN